MATDLDSDPSDSTASPESVLRFSSVRVQRLYGIDHNLEIDELCEDINVVYGSNASGKTTLAQALRMLLWPDRADDETPVLSARFRMGDASWRVRLEGTESRYQQNSQFTGPPALPPPSHDSRYHLYLPDLIAATDGDSDFAQLILQEAQGGVDLEGAAENLGFDVPSRRKSKTATAVEDLREQVKTVENEQESLRGKQRELKGLRRERAEAQEAAKRVTALEQALDVAKARRSHEEAVGKLKTFPDEMAEVQGDEAETLDSLHEKKETAQGEIEGADETINEAEAAIKDSIIPGEGIPDGQIEKLRTKRSDLQEAERNVKERSADLEGAKDKEKTAWERLSAGVSREAATEIDLPTVEAVESHVEEVESLQGEQQALDRLKQLLGDADPREAVDTLRDGLRALHLWLQHPEPSSDDRSGLQTVLQVGIGVLVASAGGFVALSAAGIVVWVGVALVVLGLILIGTIFVMRPRVREEDEEVRTLRENEFRRTGLDAPETWTRDSVERRADQLLKRLREAEVAKEKASEWKRLRPEREDAEERAEHLDTERKRIAKEIGFDPDVSSRSLAWLVDRLSQWQSAYDEVQKLQSALDTAKDTTETTRGHLNKLLTPYGFDEIDDSSDAQEALTALESAREEFRGATTTLSQAEQQKEKANEDLRDAEEEIKSLYQRLGLQVGEERKLRSLADQHADYESAVDAERKTDTVLSNELKRLRRCEKHKKWMETTTQEDLAPALDQARSKAEKKEGHIKEINTIETKIEQARDGQTLEQHRAKYREKRDELARNRERDYMKAGGHVVAEFVQEQTRDQGLPPVFERAQDLFADITNGRYELLLDRQTTSFRAHDHIEDRDFALNELSSGTKVQLLLSVRVAFVESQEQGCRAPLVLDETLANSDEERAWAIIEALQTICQGGRQIFYLTAQHDEVQKWKAAHDQPDASVECQVVQLSDVEAREVDDIGGDGAVVPSNVLSVDLPDSDDMSHDALREVLDVPQWSPRQAVNQLHLWYLIEDPTPLVDLVRDGTTTWGPFAFQYRRGGPVAVKMDEDGFRRVRARAHAVESWKEAWLVGRGEPVDRTALEASGAVSDNYIDGVSELARELQGDAEELLRELRQRTDERTKRFQSNKADELETYLKEEGYIDHRETKSPEEMWRFVLADVAQERNEGVIDTSDLDRLFERLRASDLQDHRKRG
jgi:uncharacterized protein YhaN